MTAYYNDNDPKACAWLRELAREGHITDGRVDERSIADVRADELSGFTRANFFAGIGGWDYALRLAGWPDDVPVWTGSCPCQPFSAAGKGLGTSDHRHLWPELRRLIAECRPPVVFGEQVASRAGRDWLAAVRADLEALGYAVGAADLCAAGAGAPHIRQRLYFAGYSNGAGFSARKPFTVGAEPRPSQPADSGACSVADADGGNAGHRDLQRGGELGLLAQGSRFGELADCEGVGRGRRQDDSDEGRRQRAPSTDGAAGELADAEHSERRSEHQEHGDAYGRDGSGRRGIVGDVGDASGPRLEGLSGHERVGNEPGRNGAHEARSVAKAGAPGFWSDCEWIACRDGKRRPVEPGTFPLAHGVPARVGRLRGYGNAIVPQVAAAFVTAFMDVFFQEER